MEFKDIVCAEMPVTQVKQENNNDERYGNQWSIHLGNIDVKEEFIEPPDSEVNKLLTDVVKEEYVLTYPDVPDGPDVDVIQRQFDMKPSVCEDKEVNFVNVEDITLESDNSSIEEDDKEFECFSCRQTFRKEFQLRTHLTSCFRSFECDICRRRFKCAAYLLTHKRTHVRDYSIKPTDGKKTVENLTDTSIVCSEPGCNKTFSRKYRFVVHLRIHNGDKRYQCDEVGCGKKFAELSNLDKHRRIHSGDKRFVCDQPGCDKKFSVKCNLIGHRRIHTDAATGDKVNQQ